MDAACLTELLCSLPVEVNERVDEVGDARTDVEKVDKLVVEVKVEHVGHVPLPDLVEPINESLVLCS